MQKENTSKKIEALLFMKGEPMTIKDIARACAISIEDTRKGIDLLRESLSGRGIVLVETDDSFFLGTHPDFSDFIKEIAREEIAGPLSKVAAETLAIILYKGPIAKGDIDYLRGVNSQFIIRNLLIRGLIEKVAHPKDARSFLYKISPDTLRSLGVTKRGDLPGFADYNARIDEIIKDEKNEEDTISTT